MVDKKNYVLLDAQSCVIYCAVKREEGNTILAVWHHLNIVLPKPHIKIYFLTKKNNN